MIPDVWLWLGSLSETATVWEVLATLLGTFAAGFAAWGALDNVFDLRYVRLNGRVGGPRWITAACLLAANVLFLVGWLGYTHVAVIAAYLPPRMDIGDGAANEIAAMRVVYGLCGLLGQVALRVMRTLLRNLPREQWATLFGEAARYETMYHAAVADAHTARAEMYEHRARAHTMTNRAGAADMRAQLLARLLAQHGIEVPAELRPPHQEGQQ